MPRTQVAPGGRFVHDVRAAYSGVVAEARTEAMQRNRYYEQGVIAAMYITRMLDDPETRRIVVDSEQAVRLADATEMPPVSRYRLPFDQMYIEFTTPVTLGEPDPSDKHDDVHVAMVITNHPLTPDLDILPPDVVRVTMILRSREPVPSLGRHDWADRNFYFHVGTGDALSHPATMFRARQPGAPEYLEHSDVSEFPDGALDDIDVEYGWIAARTGGAGRGWWERLICDYAQFTAWLLTYMTAKGIVIVEEKLSRQQRRAAERMKHRPPPWHVVMVDPTKYSDEEHAEGSRRGPSYRYDVRGHLRFGRHRRADGSYSQTVEWVRPHQRGLANAVYIPKTYGFDDKSPKVSTYVHHLH